MRRKLALVSAVLLVALAIPAPVLATHGGSNSQELTVVGHLNMAIGSGHISDVWAYGNYAYLGSYYEPVCSLDETGVHIVDISNPSAPNKVGFIASPPGSRANDVKVAHIETAFFTGEILVHTNEDCAFGFVPRLHSQGGALIGGQGGVAIYDVTDPTKPRSLRQNFLDVPVHNTFLYQQGNKAYMLVVGDVGERDLYIVDITKPSHPRVVANVGEPDWPSLEKLPGDVLLHDVWAQENNGRVIAYLSYWDGGLVLLDITNPASPAFLGDSKYLDPDPLSGKKPEGNSHVAVPTADGKLVIMGDEDFAPGALTSFKFNGTDYPAAEGAFTVPTYSLPGASFSGTVVWTGGEGCTVDAIPPAPAGVTNPTALIQRGTCFFQTKAENAFAQGYQAFIVANHASGGDSLVTMAPANDGPYPPIPGYFVGQSTGEAMKTAPVGAPGGTITATGIFDGWGYMRVLDVSDPKNIKELGQFATENVLTNPPPTGDRTMHNVIVEGTRAYISWYAEGMRVVDFKNPRKPRETAHFVDKANGSNFWGVYLHKHPNGNTYILGSDRDTGLWIFARP